MDYFPSDFNAQNLIGNIYKPKSDKENALLLKYRENIYREFTNSTNGWLKITVDKDFFDIYHILQYELKTRNLETTIETEKKSFIVCSDNSEIINENIYYLVIRPQD